MADPQQEQLDQELLVAEDDTSTGSGNGGEYSPAGSTTSSSSSSSAPGPSMILDEEDAVMQEELARLAGVGAPDAVARVAAAPPGSFQPGPPPARHYHHHAHGHSHVHHAHAHSHAPPPPGSNPPHHFPPPANPNNLRPIQANRQRTLRVPMQAIPQTNQNSNQLGAVRDRLFQAMLVRMALWYTARVNRTWRKVIELVAIIMAILSFLSLMTVHVMFMRVSTTCLKDIESTWPREGIVRVELVRNLAMLRKKEEQYREYRQQHLDELARSPSPVCRFSPKEVLQRGPAVLPAEIREFGYLSGRVRHSFQPNQPQDTSIFGTVMGYIYPQLYDEEKKVREEEEVGAFESMIETEEDLSVVFESEFNAFYEPDELPYYEYKVEYSLIYGLLRLPARFLATHNVSVMTKQIDSDDECLGSPAARWMMANVVGFEDPILHTLKALAINESEIGYVHDLRSSDHYHFVQMTTSKMSYVTAGVVMLLFTFAISLLLRFSHHQIFLFIVDLLHMFEHNQPLAFPAAPLLTVILALVGMEAIMSEVFNDTTTAFYVILIVWLADQFDAICCQSPTSKRYWLRFFFLHQFFFYSYQYRFGGVYGGLALMTSSLFILHSMIFFFHHYEIPLILYTDRLQRIMNELNGRLPMADPPIVQEVNLATGPHPDARGGEGGADVNGAFDTPPHAIGGVRRMVLPRNGPQRPIIGIPLNQPGRPIEHGLERRLVAAAERRLREVQNAHGENTWISSLARSVGGRLVNTIPNWMLGGEAPAGEVVTQVGERIRFRLPRGTGSVREERRNVDAPEVANNQ